VITRPIEESLKLAADLESKAVKFIIEPMLTIHKLQVEVPQADIYITTSRNALSYIPAGANRVSIPEHGKNVKELLEYIRANIKPDSGRILYLRGNKITLDIKKELQKDGYNIDDFLVYQSSPTSALSRHFVENLGKIRLATFFSTETYKNFLKLVDPKILSEIDALFVSEKLIGDTAPIWKKTYVANKPDQNSMVEKTIEIIQ
jgi:uroporphyrinogen-III synthase